MGKKENKLNTNFGALGSQEETVTYQVPCHLRAQNIGFRMRDLMNLIPGVSVKPVVECSGHNGTWAMKNEFFEL